MYTYVNRCKNNKIKQKFYTTKETIDSEKRQPVDLKKIFANQTSHIGLVSKIYRTLKQPKGKETSDQILKRIKDPSTVILKRTLINIQ
jgi:hypothetical protein